MWVAEAPTSLVQACITMLPRLEAEAAIARVNEAITAAAPAENESARQLRAQWAAAAHPAQTGPRLLPDPAPALTQAGFKVHRIPTKRRSG